MKKLVIVESPSKAKTIEKYLGKDYKVLASVGHIRDLPKQEKGTIDIENNFKPRYIIPKEKEKVIGDIKKEAKKAEEVLLATDLDREGEAIAWHIQEAIGGSDMNRIVFNEITKDAILEAIETPRKIDYNLTKSQEARRVLDRLFGYTLSKLIWKKVRYGLSAGRVQSPALSILLDKEREIRKFKPEKYYEMFATFANKNNSLDAECLKKIDDEKIAIKTKKQGENEIWEISEIKKTNAELRPKPPFKTSTLQQACNSFFSWSPSFTMRVAQKLYEEGFITYMRTDSTNLSKFAHNGIKEKIITDYGEKYYEKKVYKTKSKVAQEAHEAIRPTNLLNANGGKTKEGKKLYKLIYNRTIASQMVSAKIERTSIVFKRNDLESFSIKGSIILFDGWLLDNEFAKTQVKELPNVSKGDKFNCENIEIIEKETTPPPRYSEAGLVKELEKRNIGRPSTYASIIQTLIYRGYVEKEQRSLIPTDLGDVISTFLEKNFNSYISDEFTADMEDKLDKIAIGDTTYEKVLGDFYFDFKDEVDSKEDIKKLTTLGDAPVEFKCPKCDSGMVYKLARTGTFMSCDKFPKCLGARTKEGEIIKDPEKVNKKCPKCDAELIRRTGRFGDFISCEKYPKCKYVEEDEEERAKKDTKINCTICKKGTMIERRGRFGIFYSCSEYPDCKFAIKAKPTGNKCMECNNLMMEGTKTIPERCCDKACVMHNPHKLDKK